jgi:hypothetical protein
MVPLDTVTERSSGAEPVFVRRKPRPAVKPNAHSPTAAHEFRIVDLVTRETLADRAGTREAVDVLKELRSPVDISVYVWREQPGRWRLLTFEEKRALWDLRDA